MARRGVQGMKRMWRRVKRCEKRSSEDEEEMAVAEKDKKDE